MSSHIVEKRVYYQVFGALLLLLFLTVAATAIEDPTLGVIAAITIAVVKAVLSVLFFMHLAYSAPIVRIFAGAAFVWLFFLLMFTASDYLTR